MKREDFSDKYTSFHVGTSVNIKIIIVYKYCTLFTYSSNEHPFIQLNFLLKEFTEGFRAKLNWSDLIPILHKS